MKPLCVATLDKGVTIACGLRLNWLHLGSSKICNLFGTLDTPTAGNA